MQNYHVAQNILPDEGGNRYFIDCHGRTATTRRENRWIADWESG
jgi:hypothetical protein